MATPSGARGDAATAARARWLTVAVANGSLALAAWAAASVCVWLAIATEYGLVLWSHSARLSSSWEIGLGTGGLLPVAVLLAALVAVPVAGVHALLARARSTPARAALTAFAAAATALVGWGVGGGRHVGTLPRRLGLALLLAAVVAGLVAWLSPWLAAQLRRRPVTVSALAVVLVVGAELANATLLVRLYPAFHHGLAALAVLAAPTVMLLFREPGAQRRVAFRWELALTAALVGALGWSAAQATRAAASLAYADNFRLLVVERAPLASYVVHAATWLAPPAPLLDEEETRPAAPTGGSSELSWAGRSLLLVTVDALRADHVGAYGYQRPTTPELDRLAADGIVFERAYAPTPHTSYSLTSLMTGKHLRPLLLQGAGADSETWPTVLRKYGYHTAAFYPPAVFFIDGDRFDGFRSAHFGFEYFKEEFAEGAERLAQFDAYLATAPKQQPLFVWVHLFAPHEPYVAHPAHAFGDRDVDRYDSEIGETDALVGNLVRHFRAQRADAVAIVSADHGEEFGEHGGRYHGTTVYEEQVRVPLVVSVPGGARKHRVTEPVQTIDLMPTVLRALGVPVSPRLRGRDLGALVAGQARSNEPRGFAFAETDEASMLARGTHRLVCERRIGACRLFDLERDPGQQRDASAEHAELAQAMRTELRALGGSHGRYEQRGLRAEGRDLPAALLRGLAGDGDAAADVAELLDDADAEIRRRSAEVLFDLRRPEVLPQLRTAFSREERPEVRKRLALALLRAGQSVPLALELLEEGSTEEKRLVALTLAEQGDDRGEGWLLGWWPELRARDFRRARELLEALGKIRSKNAVGMLCAALADVRLRPYIARSLAAIGEEAARTPLATAFAEERYQHVRSTLLESLVALGARGELAPALVRFLGVPDPIQGLGPASNAGILDLIGGPGKKDLARLQARGHLGETVTLFVPKASDGTSGGPVRFVVWARAARSEGHVHLAPAVYVGERSENAAPRVAQLDQRRSVKVRIPLGPDFSQQYLELPPDFPARAGAALTVTMYVDAAVELAALALVPRSAELAPPAAVPWGSASPSASAAPSATAP